MKKERKRFLYAAIALLVAFALWTLGVRFVDVQPIGPQGSSVGLAAVNAYFHSLTGVHMTWYVLTDWLSLIPLLAAAAFAVLGLVQWIRRRSLRAVDGSLLALGGFYVLLLLSYVFFECFVVNYRPVLIHGVLEASYPSSTTMLAIGIMLTSTSQLRPRIQNRRFRSVVLVLLHLFTAFMVVGRLISGVHWLSDIVGGVLLSAGLVRLYDAMITL